MEGGENYETIPRGIHYLRRRLLSIRESPWKEDESKESCGTSTQTLSTSCGAEGMGVKRISWDGLPHDLVLQIISHARKCIMPWDSILKNLRLVSSRWNAAVTLSVKEIFLDLDGSQGLGQWKRINASFPNLTSLRTNWATSHCLENISILCNLKSLNLWGARRVSEGILGLSNLPTLEVLNLGFTDISRRGLEIVSKITQLLSLDITETLVTPYDVECLISLQALRVLKLGSSTWSRRDYKTASRYLAKLMGLKSLDVGYSQASAGELKRLMPSCTIRVGGFSC